MADLVTAPERLFTPDGVLAYATGDAVPTDQVRQLLTDAQLRAQHTPQGPRGSRPRRTETREGGPH